MVYVKDVTQGSVSWAVFMFSWPYFSIPIAFAIDEKLRARWLLQDVSRPATGYRFKGTNLQMVFTSRAARVKGASLDSAEDEGERQSRRLDCTNLWPLSVIIPAVFVCAAEGTSGAASVLFVCTPFLFLVVFSLTLSQVIIFVSLLALPVIHVIYSILNRGLGNTTINFILWSQTFVVLSAVSIAWTSRDITTLRRMTRPNGTTTTAIFNDDDDDDNTGGSIAYGRESPRETSAVEICIIQIAESMLSREDGPGQGEDQGLYLSVVRTAREAESHGLPIDTPVLQSAPALKAWRQVIQHQRDVEGHIRETHRWGALGEKLISMNAGMPFMVGIVQAVFLGLSQLENSNSFGSGTLDMSFYVSVAVYAVSLAASTVVLIRMLSLINKASHGLAAAAANAEVAMESFRHFRSWGVFKHGDVGCLTHIAARKGMKCVLEHLVHKGANPCAVDSTGQTPLDVARRAGMTSTQDFLETLAEESARDACRGGGDIGKIKGSQSLSRSRRPSLFGYRGSIEESSERGTNDGIDAARHWHHVRNFTETILRWILSGERTSRKGLGKVAAEPFDAAAKPLSLDEPQRLTGSPLPDLPISSSSSGSPHEGNSAPRISICRFLISPPVAEDLDKGDVTATNDPSQIWPIAKREDSGSCGEIIGTEGGIVVAGEDGECPAEANARSAGSLGTGNGDTNLATEKTTRATSIITVRSHQVLNSPRRDMMMETRPPTIASPANLGPVIAPTIMPTSTKTTNRMVFPLDGIKSVASKAHTVRRASVNLLSGLNSTSSSSSLPRRGQGGSCISSTATRFSPTQSVLNITWALRRLRSFGTPRDLRAGFVALRKTSPFRIPDIYLLAFTDMASLEEIPCRTGDRFLGHTSSRPTTCTELVARTVERTLDPIMVYISHRWLEPDFKNPDNYAKTKFYQVCYVVQRLAKRLGRRSQDFYLWIDYASINQQDPIADRLVLPYALDACDMMVYIEDDEYWDLALSRTEHFLFHRLRALRRLLCREDVYSLSPDGSKLTQRTYHETKTRFGHNPAKGLLATEIDRLYLWTLVLAVEYEMFHTNLDLTAAGHRDVVGGEWGFMDVLRRTMLLRSSGTSQTMANTPDVADVLSTRGTARVLEAEGHPPPSHSSPPSIAISVTPDIIFNGKPDATMSPTSGWGCDGCGDSSVGVPV